MMSCRRCACAPVPGNQGQAAASSSSSGATASLTGGARRRRSAPPKSSPVLSLQSYLFPRVPGINLFQQNLFLHRRCASPVNLFLQFRAVPSALDLFVPPVTPCSTPVPGQAAASSSSSGATAASTASLLRSSSGATAAATAAATASSSSGATAAASLTTLPGGTPVDEELLGTILQLFTDSTPWPEQKEFFAVILKVMNNVYDKPGEAKFRSLKLTVAKLFGDGRPGEAVLTFGVGQEVADTEMTLRIHTEFFTLSVFHAGGGSFLSVGL